MKDRVVVITRASSGIGEALARAVHAGGGKPVLVARRAEALAAVSKACGRALAITADVTQRDQVEAAVAKAIAQHAQVAIGRMYPN